MAGRAGVGSGAGGGVVAGSATGGARGSAALAGATTGRATSTARNKGAIRRCIHQGWVAAVKPCLRPLGPDRPRQCVRGGSSPIRVGPAYPACPRISVSASITRARMFERIVSRPAPDGLRRGRDRGQLGLERAHGLELLADGGQRGRDRRGIDLDLVLDERREREQPGEADRGLERGRLGGLGIDHAVDVVADEVERRDARWARGPA